MKLRYQPTYTLDEAMQTFHTETKREKKKDNVQVFEGDNDSVEGIMFSKNE